MPLRVLQLVGSAVSDFHCRLPRLYAGGCLRVAGDPERYETHIAYVTPDRRWRFPADLTDAAIASAAPMSVAEALGHLSSLDVDVAVPQMFCIPGMTHYRALLDVLEIPYLGNTPDVMALTSHKARTRSVVAGAGVDVPWGQVVGPGMAPAIAPPTVVKPVDADNSVGVSLVREPAQYPTALRAALDHSEEALVESYVELGREVRCGILVADGDLICLPLEEYAVDDERTPIRGYDDKLRADRDGELELAAKQSTRAWILDPGDPVTERVWEVARLCHAALGCRHYSLFDFRIDPSGRPWFIEAGLYCSFSPESVISTMASAAGIATDELFAMAVDNVLEITEATR